MARTQAASLLKLLRVLALAYVVALGGLIDAFAVGRHLGMLGVGGEVICQTHPDEPAPAPGAHHQDCCLAGCLPQVFAGALPAGAALPPRAEFAPARLAIAQASLLASAPRFDHRARGPPLPA